MADDDEPTVSVEETRVTAWRCERAQQMGFSETVAGYIGVTPWIDLHVLEALLAAGCSRQLALRIVS